MHQNLIGKTINSYSIVSLIDQGNFGKVYYAINQKDKSVAAIKAMPIKMLNDNSKVKELVLGQIKALSETDNKNVVKLIASFKSKVTLFIVLQYCDGGNLQKYVGQKTRLQEQSALRFLKQILNGFKGLHQNKIMHRDFKLANVVLKDGICKIVDLGLAKNMTKQNLTGTICGTPITMAPQILGEQLYGMQADLWSIGVSYYQMLFGLDPFGGQSSEQLLENIRKNNIKFNFQGVNEISDQSKDFIKKCLTVDPKQRITWAQVYQHALMTKVEFGKNKNYANQKKFYKNQSNEPFKGVQGFINQKDLKDIQNLNIGQEAQILQTVNPQKLIHEAKQKQLLLAKFKEYESLYVNKLLSIKFIFKFIYPCIGTISKFNFKNFVKTIFLMIKQAYLETKDFLFEVKENVNMFQLKQNWKQFCLSKIYADLIQQISNQLDGIEKQGAKWWGQQKMQDLQYDQKLMIEIDIYHLSTDQQTWKKILKSMIQNFCIQLSAHLFTNTQNNREKVILIRLIQALEYYSQFDKKKVSVQQFSQEIKKQNVADVYKVIKAKYSKFQKQN